MVRAMPRQVAVQLRERHGRIDAQEFWLFVSKCQHEMANKLEDSNNVNKTEANIQTMIGPYRKWAAAQRRNGYNDKYNKGSGK